ncbi:bifunctional chorismate-binding protein/class IV aminotransferase [Kingella kingae]|uniref:bifunctional chorismate-binding protein/class IV aminotransferase n=1 Tax=Kingella kingae TaxID=504 RepID=UPI00040B8A8F|nr:bifunctional chorismate-binding protein/class IV aminotransferase [Kingella kingae]
MYDCYTMSPFILFDDALTGRAFLLHDWVCQDTLSPEQLPLLDETLQAAWAKNWHAALWIDYEFGLGLQKLPAAKSSLHLFWFAQKTPIDDVPTWLQQQGGDEPAGLSAPRWSSNQAEYERDIDCILAAIARGDCYQINHTLRLYTQTYGSPIRLYARLRQAVPYAALACLPNGEWTLCFSPELFLRINAQGSLHTEPMKGTAPILGDENDTARAIALQNDPKNRAENTMIVDLLRNDLGKIATVGGVSVPAPFSVNAFGSVWQMTSLVQAQLLAATTMAQIVQAAFPCGSITGAPKRKSMEMIAQLEREPRQLYTGSIGYLEHAPNTPLGFSGCLNVVIRTLQLRPHDQAACTFDGIYGVGSGIVADSQAVSEYAECGWKARFISELRPEFALFETMRVAQNQIAWLDDHLARLAHSAAQCNIPFCATSALHAIEQTLPTLDANRVYRLKLRLEPTGSLHLEHAPIAPLPDAINVLIAPDVLPTHDFLRRYKTTHRAQFDRAWQWAEQHGAFDALLFNEQGYLLEGGRSSVIVRYQNQWLTPAADLDVLPSVALKNWQGEAVQAAWISREQVQQAEQIWLGNALRGWRLAKLIAV